MRQTKEDSASKRGEPFLTKEQIAQLDAIGMKWQMPVQCAWESAFEKAEAYYGKNRHLKVEKGYVTEDGFRLDLWVNRQRKYYREGNQKALPQENVVRLTEIGMEW